MPQHSASFTQEPAPGSQLILCLQGTGSSRAARSTLGSCPASAPSPRQTVLPGCPRVSPPNPHTRGIPMWKGTIPPTPAPCRLSPHGPAPGGGPSPLLLLTCLWRGADHSSVGARTGAGPAPSRPPAQAQEGRGWVGRGPAEGVPWWGPGSALEEGETPSCWWDSRVPGARPHGLDPCLLQVSSLGVPIKEGSSHCPQGHCRLLPCTSPCRCPGGLVTGCGGVSSSPRSGPGASFPIKAECF